MKPEIKEMWVNALLSGDYTQARGRLRTESGFCCLGVLCDLYSQETNKNWQGKRFDYSEVEEVTEFEISEFNFDSLFFDDELQYLPQAVVQWAGLDNANPSVGIRNSISDDKVYTEYVELSQLNDTGYSFKQITKYIQESL